MSPFCALATPLKKRARSSLGLTVARLDFADTRRWQAATHGQATFLSGGLLSVYDGLSVAEAGFLARPTTPTTALGGSGINAVTGFRYVATYESVDEAVAIHGRLIGPVAANYLRDRNQRTVASILRIYWMQVPSGRESAPARQTS